MGEFKLTKWDIDEVVNIVNSKGQGNWNQNQLGYALQEEIQDANWRALS